MLIVFLSYAVIAFGSAGIASRKPRQRAILIVYIDYQAAWGRVQVYASVLQHAKGRAQ